MTDETAMPRVVIADDHSGFLDQVAALVRSEFNVVATAHDGIAALDCIRRFYPDIAVLDLYMPGMNGLEVVKTLHRSAARTVTVVMSGYNDPELANAAINAGAMAFVPKSRLTQDLLPAMRAALEGHVFLPDPKNI
jgi:DNA-binding NarL/FixJ family response regulator